MRKRKENIDRNEASQDTVKDAVKFIGLVLLLVPYAVLAGLAALVKFILEKLSRKAGK